MSEKWIRESLAWLLFAIYVFSYFARTELLRPMLSTTEWPEILQRLLSEQVTPSALTHRAADYAQSSLASLHASQRFFGHRAQVLVNHPPPSGIPPKHTCAATTACPGSAVDQTLPMEGVEADGDVRVNGDPMHVLDRVPLVTDEVPGALDRVLDGRVTDERAVAEPIGGILGDERSEIVEAMTVRPHLVVVEEVRQLRDSTVAHGSWYQEVDVELVLQADPARLCELRHRRRCVDFGEPMAQGNRLANM